MRNPRSRAAILLILTILIAARIFSVARTFYYSSYLYADVGMGDRRVDVQYGLGEPLATLRDGVWRRGGKDKANASVWTYRSLGGGRVNIAFGPDGAVASATCVDLKGLSGSCPALYRVGIGEDEGRIGYALGYPDRQEIVGDAKIMFYDDIGVAYGLKRYTVYKIVRLRGHAGLFGQAGRFLHMLLPP